MPLHCEETPDGRPQRRRSITFQDSVEVQIIEHKSDIVPEEKRDAWYNQKELKKFRQNARFISSTLQSADLFQSFQEMSYLASQYGVDHIDMKNTRGLELRLCEKRREERYLAVKAILDHHEDNKDDHEGLSEIAQKMSQWAQKEAHESALRDQQEAAKHACKKGSKDDIVCKLKNDLTKSRSRRRRGSMMNLSNRKIACE